MKIRGYEFREDRHYLFGGAVQLWVKLGKDGKTARIGVDDLTQKLSRGVSFVFFQVKPGSVVRKGDLLCTLETAKMVLPLSSPLAGKISSLNIALNDNPSLINSSPFDGGWILEIEAAGKHDLNSLLNGSDLKTLEHFAKEIDKYEA